MIEKITDYLDKKYFIKKLKEGNAKEISLFLREYPLPSLTNTEKEDLIKLLIDTSYISTLCSLLLYLEPKYIKEILNLCPCYNYEYTFAEVLKKRSKEILDCALTLKNEHLLLAIASIDTYKHVLDTEDLTKMKSYLLNLNLNKSILNIISAPRYLSKEFEEKIITGTDEEILNFLKLKNSSYIKEFLTKYLLRIYFPTFNKIVAVYKDDEEIYDYLLNMILNNCIWMNNETRSEYLLTMLKASKKAYFLITTRILSLLDKENLPLIKETMNELTEEEQNTICIDTINKNDLKSIYNLAITTDCISTYKLIDIVLNNDTISFDLITQLVGNLKGRFLSYALSKIIKTKGSKYYLHIINRLYLEGNIKFISSIEAIFIYGFESLFDKTILKRLKAYINPQETNLKLTRNK